MHSRNNLGQKLPDAPPPVNPPPPPKDEGDELPKDDPAEDAAEPLYTAGYIT